MEGGGAAPKGGGAAGMRGRAGFMLGHRLWRWPGIIPTVLKSPMLLAIMQQTRDIAPMLFERWATVYDAGPTLKQHFLKESTGRFPGYMHHTHHDFPQTRLDAPSISALLYTTMVLKYMILCLVVSEIQSKMLELTHRIDGDNIVWPGRANLVLKEFWTGSFEYKGVKAR